MPYSNKESNEKWYYRHPHTQCFYQHFFLKLKSVFNNQNLVNASDYIFFSYKVC